MYLHISRNKIWCLPASPIHVPATLVESPDKGGAKSIPIQWLRSDSRFRAPGGLEFAVL